MTLYIAWSGYANGDSCTLNTGASAFNMTIPSGFSPWDNTGTTIWDIATKGWNINLTNNFLTVQRFLNTSWSGCSIKSTTSQSTGKYYFEYYVNTFPNVEPYEQIFGLVNSTANLNLYVGINVDSLGYQSNGTGLQIPIWQDIHASLPGQYIGIAVDIDNSLVWARCSSSTNWNNSPTANPATGTGGFSVNILKQAAVQGFINNAETGIGEPCALSFSNNVIFSTGPADSQIYLTSYNFRTGSINSYADISTQFNQSPTFQSNYMCDINGLPWSLCGGSETYALSQFLPGATWNLGLHWGTPGNIPNGIPVSVNGVWCSVGTANYIWGGGFNGTIWVCRANGGADLGFWGHSYTTQGNTNQGCLGPQDVINKTVTIYWTSVPYPSFPEQGWHLGKTVINNNAAEWAQSEWPTPNPGITSEVILSYQPTTFDPAWTTLGMSGPIYDQTDGNLLLQVSGTGGGNPAYIVKVSSINGAILWSTPVANNIGFDAALCTLSVISASTYLYFAEGGVYNPGILYVINTMNGQTTSYTLFSAAEGVYNFTNQISNDALGCIIGNCSWTTAGNYISLFNSTPTTGNSLAAVYFANSLPSPSPYQRCTGQQE